MRKPNDWEQLSISVSLLVSGSEMESQGRLLFVL